MCLLLAPRHQHMCTDPARQRVLIRNNQKPRTISAPIQSQRDRLGMLSCHQSSNMLPRAVIGPTGTLAQEQVAPVPEAQQLISASPTLATVKAPMGTRSRLTRQVRQLISDVPNLLWRCRGRQGRQQKDAVLTEMMCPAMGLRRLPWNQDHHDQDRGGGNLPQRDLIEGIRS